MESQQKDQGDQMSTNKVVMSLGAILNEIMDSKNQEKEITDLL